mmetsp:Transcript_49896/g.78019  ORF Transcript_49896/g.78019 Transcript_49896/m.78019 type:complete len:365 (-) Transcript_49896:72-1166(-)
MEHRWRACVLVLLTAVFQEACARIDAEATAVPEIAATPAPTPASTAEAKATEDLQGQATEAFQVIIDDLLTEMKKPGLQWVNAIVAAVLGIAALYDGRSTAKLIVIACVGGVAFFMVASRLHWSSQHGQILKYVAASEVGVFAAYCAYRGYGGHHAVTATSAPQRFSSGSTELVLGFSLGMYMFHLLQGLLLNFPYVDVSGPWFDVVVGTMLVLLGCWMVFENYGAGRVFGVLAPLFGSSLVISAIGYAVMLSCSVPVVGKQLHIEVPRSAVEPVISFWLMLVSPLSNKEVGIFEYLHKDLVLGKTTIQVDRILGMLFMVIFWLISACVQLKKDRAKRGKYVGVKGKGFGERLLGRSGPTQEQP